jgi:hypothetical protein
MKSTCLSLIAAFCFASLTNAQNLYSKKDPVRNTIVKTSENESGGVDVTVLKQRKAFELNQSGIIISGAETENLNQLFTYSYNTEGKLIGKVEDAYSLKGGEKKVGDLINSKAYQTISLANALDKYPELFKSSNTIFYKADIVQVSSYKSYFDPFSLNFSGKEDTKVFQPRHPNYETNKKMNTFSHNYLINHNLGNVTTYFGNKDMTKDKEKKFQYLQDYDFITYDFNKKIINKFNAKFKYSRYIYYTANVISEDDPTKNAGKVFVFYKARKKDGPELSMFDIIYTTNDGELIFQAETNLGCTDKYNMTIDIAFGNNERINFFGNTRIGEDVKVGIVSVNKDGSTNPKFINNPDLTANQQVLNIANGVKPAANRDALGPFAKAPSYKIGFDENFDVSVIKKMANSNYLICGQMRYEIPDPNAPEGSSTISGPKVFRYAEFICFQIAADLSIKKLYINDLPPIARKAPIKIIAESETQIAILLPVATSNNITPIKKMQTLRNIKMEDVSKYEYNVGFVPSILKINIETKEAKQETHAAKLIVNPNTICQYNSKSNTLFVPVSKMTEEQSIPLELSIFSNIIE